MRRHAVGISRRIRDWTISCVLLAVLPSEVGAALWTLLPQQADPPGIYTNSVLVRDSRRARFIATSGVTRGFFHGPFVGYNRTTWSLDLADTSQPWRRIESATASPLVEHSTAVYDSISDRVFLYGGSRQPDPFVATYEFPRALRVLDLGSAVGWQTRAVDTADPPGLAGASTVVDPLRRRLLLFGGRDSLGVVHSELWAYDLVGDTWSLLPTSSPAPDARFDALLVYDAARDRMVLTSGRRNFITRARDTWSLSLDGTPSWNLLDDGATTTGGPLVGSIDPSMDRIVAIKGIGPSIPATDDSVRVVQFSLGDASGWRVLPTEGAGPAPGTVGSWPAAFDPITGRMPIAWDVDANQCNFCSTHPSRSHVLFVAPQPLVELTAVLDSTSYLTGTATTHWTVHADRPLYSPPVVRASVDGGPPSVWRNNTQNGEYPDVEGHFSASSLARPGLRYALEVSWLDGETERTTPAVFLDTPPAPVSTIVNQLPLEVHGGSVGGGAMLTGDSTRWLAPTQVEWHAPNEQWQVLGQLYPAADGALGWLDNAPTRLVPTTYRLSWGPPDARRYSSEQTITVPPLPAFERRTAWPDSLEIVWFMDGGFPLTGTVYAVQFNDIIPLATVHANAGGHARFVDHNVVPDGVYQYRLGWDDSGVPSFTSDLVIGTPSRDVTPPPPGPSAVLALLPPHPNPASGQAYFSFTLADSTGSHPARLQLLDLTGRVRWSSIAVGSGLQTRDLRTHALPEGLYFLRLTQNGVSRQRRITLLH